MDKEQLLERYIKVPTANIVDAMDRLGVARGVVQGLARLSATQQRAAGFALTVKQMQRHQTEQGRTLATHMQVVDELAQPGDLLVIDVGGRRDVCTGGALIALRAKMRGVTGYLINGCLRDVQEIAALGFPVYFLGASPVKSSPDLQTVAVNSTVEIGGVQIRPGDLIVHDDTGVVVIPPEQAAAVLAEAEAIMDKESKAEQLIKQGYSVAEAFKGA